MNKLIALICFFFATTCFAQKYPDAGLNKVRLSLSGMTIVASLDPVSSDPKAKTGLSYYWYSANEIHMTQGGYSGRLLNGLYTEYYKNKNLKSQGNFRNGLKNGRWRSWNEDGTLSAETNWKTGREIAKKTKTLWQRLLFFRKKKEDTDSLKRSVK